MASSDGQPKLSSVRGGELLKITSPANWIALVGLLALLAGGLFWSFFGKLSVSVSGQAVLLPAGGVRAIRTLKPGIVQRLFFEPGDNLSTGDTVAHLVPTGGEVEVHNVLSQNDGFVLNRLAESGSFLTAGESLYTVGIGSKDRLSAWLFVPFEEVAALEENMVVHLEPIGLSTDQNGYLRGRVRNVERFPANEQRILDVFGDDPRWANFLLGDKGPKALLLVDLDQNPQGQYLWTMGDGSPPPLQHGMMCSGRVRVSSDSPIDSVMSKSKEK